MRYPFPRMTLSMYRHLIASDVYRYHGKTGTRAVLRELCFGIGAKYSIWMHTTKYLRSQGWPALPFYLVSKWKTKRLAIRYGLDIPWSTEIGPGLYIGHYGGIVVNDEVIIGRNCNLNHGVTLGVSKRGRVGAPRIGNDVYIGPGAKVFGRVDIGDHAAIGANAVVSRNVRPYSIVITSPCEVIACNPNGTAGMIGSSGWINRTDYPQCDEEDVTQGSR